MKHKLINIYYYLLIVRLSLKAISKLNLGDEVIYKGKRYFLTQGVCNPKWNMSGDGEYLQDIHKNDFKKVSSPKAWWKSFKHSYDFYMNYWYGIWCRNGIEDWMRECNIWNKK